MSVPPLRWGVLGTAGINDKVIPAMQQCRLGTVEAIASRDPGRAAASAERFGIPASYGSYEALLADPAIEAVYLPLPNFLHLESVLAAVGAGKHVLCEKPMALTAADARRMRAAADEAGVQLAEAFMYGHHPRYDRIAEIISSGELGEIRSISATFTFDASDETGLTVFSGRPGGGAVYDVGCYLTHVARRLLGAEPTAVTASSQWSARHGGVDMMTAGLVEFGDLPLLMQCGMWAADKDHVEVHGQRGRLEVPSAFFCAPGNEGFTVYVGDEVREETVPAANHYTLQADDLASTVRHGTSPRYPAGDAAANAMVLEACLESARTHRRVTVGYASAGTH